MFNDDEAREALEHRNKLRGILSSFLNVEAGRDGEYTCDVADQCMHLIYGGEVEVIADIIENFTPDEIAMLLCNVAMIAMARTSVGTGLKNVQSHTGQFVN